MSLRAGDKVNHDSYCLGTVMGIEGTGGDSSARIDFDSVSTGRLLLRHSPVTKL